MIETVIFDMDGVIIDSEPIHLEIQQDLFEHFQVQLTKEEYLTFIGRSSRNMWQELIQRFSLAATVDEVLHKDRSLYHQRLINEPGLAPIAGVRELIEELQKNNVKLALASSSSMESINLVLDLFDLSGFFPHRVSGDELKQSKPHPEIFQVTATLTKSFDKNCLVFEDSTHGVTAAKAANMKCVGFQNPNSGNQDLSKADLIINDFKTFNYDKILAIA